MAWLKDCEICNTGLCSTVNDLKERGFTEHAACVQMSEESEGLYSTKAILNRYLWHTGRAKVSHNGKQFKRRYLTDIEKERIMSDEFNAAYEMFYGEVINAIHGNFKSTSREAVIKCANNVIDLALHKRGKDDDTIT